VKLWNAKFTLSLAVVALFLLDAFWLGPDPVTGAARHLVPYADTGVASFAFLLSLLYVISHGWQFLTARVRGAAPRAEEPAPSKRRKKGRGADARKAR